MVHAELPEDVAAELSGDEQTVKDAVLSIRDDLGYGAVKISAWFSNRGLDVSAWTVTWVLKSEGRFKTKDKPDGDNICECCNSREKAPGFRKLCQRCFSDAGSNNSIFDEHMLLSSGGAAYSGRQRIAPATACRTGMKSLSK